MHNPENGITGSRILGLRNQSEDCSHYFSCCLLVFKLTVSHCIVTVMCYGPRSGASADSDSCQAKDGNPFGPFWDTFNIDFDHSEYYGPLGFNTDQRSVAKKWHERLAVWLFVRSIK